MGIVVGVPDILRSENQMMAIKISLALKLDTRVVWHSSPYARYRCADCGAAQQGAGGRRQEAMPRHISQTRLRHNTCSSGWPLRVSWRVQDSQIACHALDL